MLQNVILIKIVQDEKRLLYYNEPQKKRQSSAIKTSHCRSHFLEEILTLSTTQYLPFIIRQLQTYNKNWHSKCFKAVKRRND